MKALLRAVLSAAVAAIIVAGAEAVVGYPRPSEASSAFFILATASYFPLLLVAVWLFSVVLPRRGVDLWFPVASGAVRIAVSLASEAELSLWAWLVIALGSGASLVAFRKLADLGAGRPPFLFALTVGMVLPVLAARMMTVMFAARFQTPGRAFAVGAFLGIGAFVLLRIFVSKWPKAAPIFLLGPIVSLALWSRQSPQPPSTTRIATSTADRPDIVLIVLDTVRAQSLAAYGHSRNTMPNLEAFARQATTFRKAWTNGSWTLPGHISLFSGLRLTRHRYDSGFAAPERSSPDLFLASRLRGAGYATAAVAANFGVFGREEPALAGFDRVEVEPLRPFAFRPWLFDLAARFPRSAWFRPSSARFPAPTMRAPWAVDHALRFWTQTSRGPRFLFVNLMDAHLPWIPEPEDLGRFGPLGLDVESEQLEVLGRYRTGGRPTPQETEILRSRYDESLHSLDRSLSRLLEGLSADTRSASTIIVVTSDHGESLGEHDRFGHRNSLDEEATRIPLIVRGPGLVVGESLDAPVQLTDVFGYLVKSAGLEVDSSLDARPFGHRTQVVVEHRPGPQGALPSSYPRGDLSALIEWPYKYVEGSTVEPSLFDLSADPGEIRNLVADQGPRVERMLQALHAISGPPSAGKFAPDRAAEERLRALGYVR